MNFKKIKRLSDDYLIPFYRRFDIAFLRGKGVYLYDSNGDRFLDFTSGIGVVNLGHSNRKVVRALVKQAKRLFHTSNLYYIPRQWELARLISRASFEGKTFFCNSGAEANESALKVARWLGVKKSPDKTKILTLTGSFHGRTCGALSITGQKKYRDGFGSLLEDVVYVKANDVEDLEKHFDDRVCAVFLEAVQGEGGIVPLDVEFVRKARELADKHSALMVFDEVQVGMGRTGKFWGYEHYDVQPDAITIAKALGNGFPVAAFHLSSKFADLIEPGIHASTFGGNHLAVSVGIAVMKQINTRLLKRVDKLGAFFMGELKKLKDEFPHIISDVRGRGLVLGIEMKEDGMALKCVNELIDKKILTLTAGKNTLRLLPPLIIEKSHIEIFLESFRECLFYLS